jgi:hypothetical protein
VAEDVDVMQNGALKTRYSALRIGSCTVASSDSASHIAKSVAALSIWVGCMAKISSGSTAEVEETTDL